MQRPLCWQAQAQGSAQGEQGSAQGRLQREWLQDTGQVVPQGGQGLPWWQLEAQLCPQAKSRPQGLRQLLCLKRKAAGRATRGKLAVAPACVLPAEVAVLPCCWCTAVVLQPALEWSVDVCTGAADMLDLGLNTFCSNPCLVLLFILLLLLLLAVSGSVLRRIPDWAAEEELLLLLGASGPDRLSFLPDKAVAAEGALRCCSSVIQLCRRAAQASSLGLSLAVPVAAALLAATPCCIAAWGVSVLPGIFCRACSACFQSCGLPFMTSCTAFAACCRPPTAAASCSQPCSSAGTLSCMHSPQVLLQLCRQPGWLSPQVCLQQVGSSMAAAALLQAVLCK